ncbi:MAG: hypothetical protein IJT44_11915 [Clostridia bacterium]|nr:hypothetical protein [Clostridia bacterium]
MPPANNELRFLGTGAADWNTPNKDGFFRRNAAALLNGTLLLDCGPRIWDYEAEVQPGALDGVTDVLLTHDHEDHFDLSALLKLAETRKLRLMCDGFARAKIGRHPHIETIPVLPYVPLRMGGFTVTSVPANHDVVMQDARSPVHYILRTPNGKTVFYGLDGAWFLRPSWKEMLRHKFDVMVLDCTVGDRDDWRIFEHNSIPMLRMMTREIISQKMLAPDGCIVASHFARALHGSHAETAAVLERFHVRAAFDGMRIVF